VDLWSSNVFDSLAFPDTGLLSDTTDVHCVVCLFTAQVLLCLPTEGWPGSVDQDGWLYIEMVHLPADGQPSQY